MDSADNTGLVETFEAQVARNPEAVAIEDGASRLTYSQLNRKANQLARAVIAQPAEADQPVAFLLDHGIEQVIAILALLKAGRIAVALDSAYPAARLSAMIADSGCALILVSDATAALKAKLAARLPSLHVDVTGSFSDENLGRAIEGSRYANIYYTSGSTGEPKGVIQTHENVLRFMLEMGRDWNITAADRLIQIVSCSFSAVLLPILVPLLHGASVVPFDLRRLGTLQLQETIIRQGISVLFCVPSVFRALPENAGSSTGCFWNESKLRLCVFTGEPLHAEDIRMLRRMFGAKCSARNLFGGSEMHQVATLRIEYDTPIDDGTVPVGKPAASKEVLLLNDRGENVPPGEIGELLVRSRYLSPGYWQRGDLTRAAFIEADEKNGVRGYRSGDLGRMRPDGLLELLGRGDSKVNVRGQLVETAAIEAGLLAHPEVREAAVSVLRAGTGSEQLVAWVVGIDQHVPEMAELKSGLVASLPPFMVPAIFIRLDSLPRTATGKVDRLSLQTAPSDYLAGRRECTPPRNELEGMVTAEAEKILGVHPVGVTDDLFALGLDSLRYADLHVALESRLGRTLPQDLFIYARTVEQILSPESQRGFEPPISGVPGGAQEYGKSWRRLQLEMWVRFQIARLIGLVLPFKVALAGLTGLCRRNWFQRSWPVRGRVRLIKDMLASIDTKCDPEQVVERSLVCNFFQPWLLGTISRRACDQAGGDLRIDGLDHYDTALNQGKGVILAVSHFGIPHGDLLALERTGRGNVQTLGSFGYELRLMGLDHLPHVPLSADRLDNFLFRANFLRRASAALRTGGTVRLAADGLHGENTLSFAFNGRSRQFRPGFAELAFETGAAVVPVFSVLSEQGALQIEFLPTLEFPGSAARREATCRMVEQYVQLLEQRWILDPGSVVWEIAQAHLDSPLTE